MNSPQGVDLQDKRIVPTLYQDLARTNLLTMPVATDTLVGKATTDVFTNKTLTAPVINGAVTTTGLTMPAFTLGGTLNANGQDITGFSHLHSVDNPLSSIERNGAAGWMIYTTDAAGTAAILRFHITGGAATAIMAWSGITHSGLVLSGALTLNGQVFDAGAGSAQINTTGAGKGLGLQSTNDGSYGAYLEMYQVSASPAINDRVAMFDFSGKDDGGTKSVYGAFYSRIENVAAATKSGYMEWTNLLNGTLNLAMTLSSAGALWTDLSVDTLTYKVSGTQVVGARVVDARADDVVDATYGAEEAGVLDALRDAMIAHGLIAAA